MDQLQYVMLAFSYNVTILLRLLAAPGGHMSINSVTIIGFVDNVIKVDRNITVIVAYSLGEKQITRHDVYLLTIDEELDARSVIITMKTMGVDLRLCLAILSVGI